MANVNIYLSDKQEIQLKKLAQAEGKSISQFCRERITESKEQEEPLNRVTIESEIDELKKTIRRMNNSMVILSKELLRQSKLNSELSNAFINLALQGNAEKQLAIYNKAEQEADSFVNKMFEGD